MVDQATLEASILEFRHKSFGFDRTATVDGTEYAVFTRRETLSESRLRPDLVRLFVVVPLDRIVLDLTDDALRLAPDGALPGPRSTDPALESAADPSAFDEQGIPFTRAEVPAGIAYVPTDVAAAVLAPPAAEALGFGP